MQPFEDGDRSGLLGIIQQHRVLRRDGEHQSIWQREHPRLRLRSGRSNLFLYGRRSAC